MMDHLDTECELQGSEGKNESDEKSMYYFNDDGICANTHEMNGNKGLSSNKIAASLVPHLQNALDDIENLSVISDSVILNIVDLLNTSENKFAALKMGIDLLMTRAGEESIFVHVSFAYYCDCMIKESVIPVENATFIKLLCMYYGKNWEAWRDMVSSNKNVQISSKSGGSDENFKSNDDNYLFDDVLRNSSENNAKWGLVFGCFSPQCCK